MQTRDRADSPQTGPHEAEGIAVSATRQEKGEIMDERRTVDELRSLMRQVYLPGAVRENVLLEAAHPDVAEPTGASTTRTVRARLTGSFVCCPLTYGFLRNAQRCLL